MNQTYRITGTKPKSSSTVEFDGCIVFLEYPSDLSWTADLLLEVGRKQYPYRVITDGVPSSWSSLDIELDSYPVEDVQAFNTLDLHGDFYDTDRLKGERNQDYKDRLMDVLVHRGGPHFVGLVNAICRDLNLDYEDHALKITRGQDPTTGDEWKDLFLEVTDSFVRLSSDSFRKTREEVFPTPGGLYLEPSEWMLNDVLVEDSSLNTISNYKLDLHRNRIYLQDEDIQYDTFYVSYSYEKRVNRVGRTVQQVGDDIEAIQTANGYSLVYVDIASGYESKDAAGLSILPLTRLQRTHTDAANQDVSYLPIRWSDAFLHQVSDKEYQDNFRLPWGSLYNTQISSYAQALINLSKSTWGTLVADESSWGSEDFPVQGGQYLDTIFDPHMGFWLNPTTGKIYTTWNKDQDSGAVYSGPTEDSFQSGVGSKWALKMVVGTNTRSVGTEPEADSLVSGDPFSQSVPNDNSPINGGVELA